MRITKLAALFILLLVVSSFGQMAATKISQPEFPASKAISEPTIFLPNLVSTGAYEAVPELSPDGKTFYFAKGTPDFNFWTVCFSNFENGKWTPPQVAPFSGEYSDADEFITYDGRQMYFISRRPAATGVSPNISGKYDIWMMDKTADGWGTPKNLGNLINSEKNEYFPTLTRDGKTLYFGSQRAGGFGSVDLYRAHLVDGKWSAPENLGDAINTDAAEFEPFIAPDESFLIFMAADRPDGMGGFDLFISYNENGKWTKAQNLGAPIDSAADELSPKITPDGKYFFWSSTRSAIDKPKTQSWNFAALTNSLQSPQNGLGDIYYIDIQALKIKKPN